MSDKKQIKSPKTEEKSSFTSNIPNFGSLADILKSGKKASDLANKTISEPEEIRLDLISEDPSQPRKSFDMDALEDLAASIESRGVKLPISLRLDEEKAGHYIINHGARRYRASMMAGLDKIPAFVDEAYIPLDQLIENIQRDNLKPQEISDFLGRFLDEGMTQKEIAEAIGKSQSYVSQHVRLLNLPQTLNEVFQEELCQDVTLLNELSSLYKRDEDEVKTWIQDNKNDINRSSVRFLREYLKSLDLKEKAQKGLGADSELEAGVVLDDKNPLVGMARPTQRETKSLRGSNKSDEHLKRPVLKVAYKGKIGELILNKKPTKEGLAWIRFKGLKNREIPLDKIKLLAIIEG